MDGWPFVGNLVGKLVLVYIPMCTYVIVPTTTLILEKDLDYSFQVQKIHGALISFDSSIVTINQQDGITCGNCKCSKIKERCWDE